MECDRLHFPGKSERASNELVGMNRMIGSLKVELIRIPSNRKSTIHKFHPDPSAPEHHPLVDFSSLASARPKERQEIPHCRPTSKFDRLHLNTIKRPLIHPSYTPQDDPSISNVTLTTIRSSSPSTCPSSVGPANATTSAMGLASRH